MVQRYAAVNYWQRAVARECLSLSLSSSFAHSLTHSLARSLSQMCFTIEREKMITCSNDKTNLSFHNISSGPPISTLGEPVKVSRW